MSQTVPPRVEPRYEINEALAVTVTIEPEDRRLAPFELTATMLNLSASGAKLLVPMRLENDRALHVKLAMDHLGVSFHLAARVCWTEQWENGAYVIGCRLSPEIPEGILQQVVQGGTLNRRDHGRRTADVALRFAPPGTSQWRRRTALLRNYAAGGVCLETTRSAAPGEILRLYPDRRRFAEFDVTVRWVLQQSDRYIYGCEYTDAEAFERLQRSLAEAT